MAAVVAQRTRPDVVGREIERRRIGQALSRAAAEGGVAVLISGETGVGKTALGLDALARAEDRGFLALQCGSNPLTREVAYSPMIQVLGSALRRFEAPERDRLISDLSALGALFVGMGFPDPVPLGDAALERTRLFEAVLRLIDRISRQVPVAILLDDLQWFDRDSVELLAYTTRDLSGLPVLLVATFRSGDDQSDPLLHLLQTWRRRGVAVEIELAGLSENEVRDIAARMLGNPASESLVELFMGHCAGVPLFIESMISALQINGMLREENGMMTVVRDAKPGVPPVARAAIQEQLERLSDEERELVDLLAVGGGQVPWGVLSEVAANPNAEASLAHVTRTGLVVEKSEGELTYGFAHPLMLEVAYAEVSNPRRVSLHGRFARAWEKKRPDDLGTIALHYRRALPQLDLRRAIELSVAAGRKALDRYANEEALAHLAAALDLTQADSGRAEILELCGEAQFRLSDFNGAVASWREALDGVRDSDDRAAGLHLLIARALSSVLSDEWRYEVDAGLAALDGTDNDEDKVELLYLASVNAHRRSEFDEGLQIAERISVVADLTDTDRAKALAVIARASALIDIRELDEAIALLGSNRPLLHRSGAELELFGHVLAATIAAARGDLPALRNENRNALRLARRSGLPNVSFRIQGGEFVDAFYSGDWERARETVTEIGVMAEATDHWPSSTFAGLLSAVLHVFKGEFDAAESLLADPELWTTRVGLTPALTPVVAALCALEQEDPALALSELARTEATWYTSSVPSWRPVVVSEALARLGRGEEALEAAIEFARLGGEGSYPEAMAGRLEGLALEALRETERAQVRLQRASERFSELGMPFEAARAGIELVELKLRHGGRSEDLVGHLEHWYRVVDGLGAGRYIRRARRLLHALGKSPPTDGRRSVLTPRQSEVAGLVAQGLSNAEIAEALFISVRTVESHLDHIYTRLNFNSRVALATYIAADSELTT